MPETVEITVNRRSDGTHDPLEMQVRLDRVIAGLYLVYREDNGRELGRVEKRDSLWRAYAHIGAFRGAGPDDLGDVLDKVPAPLYNGGAEGIAKDETRSAPVAYDRLRYGAVSDLLQYLYRKGAPAAGHARRCPGVQVHTVPATGEDRRCRR